MARKKIDWGGVIALFLFVGIPIGIPTVIGARRAIIAWSVRNQFEPVEATILSSKAELEVIHHRDDPDVFLHHPIVRFEYSVAGVTHDTGVYAHPAAGVSVIEEDVNEIVARYSPGATHAAWYDPDDPAMAYLHLDSPWGGIWTIGKTLIIAALIYGGIIAAVVLIQRQR